MPLSEESPCVTLYQSETTCRPDAVAELQGQFQNLQQASTNQSAEAGRGQQTHCSDAGASQLEESLDAFLTAAEDFNHLFHTVYTLVNSAWHSFMHSLLYKLCLKVNVERVKHPGMWPTCYMLFALLIQAIPGRGTFANYTGKP